MGFPSQGDYTIHAKRLWYNEPVMMTHEGEALNRCCPRSEYPRPQFQRDSYFCLNGAWEFCKNQSPEHPSSYPKTILVPFSVESPLSGVKEKVGPHDFLHYRKTFSAPEGFAGKRVLIHFDAVDQVADVYCNGVLLGHHEGGYIPFEVEVPSLEQENELILLVKDDTSSPFFPRGKQNDRPGGIWYHPTSGIWGSVWMETIPEKAVRSMKITPRFDEKKVGFQLDAEKVFPGAYVSILFQGKEVARALFNEFGFAEASLSSCFHPWSPEEPALYRVLIGCGEDRVSSYFGMRKFGKAKLNGETVFALNDMPYLMKGVLDQGYFPDGGLTAPSDKAMVDDIALMKRMGFNMLRKHIKIEPLRWYYHCDVMGMLVIQDFVNVGKPYKPLLLALAPFLHLPFKDDRQKDYRRFGVGEKESRERFEAQVRDIPALLGNVVSLCAYVVFNEGWGQFDSARVSQEVKNVDPSRLVDAHCGWFDQGAGDFSGDHIYFRKIRMANDRRRILFLSEFGGYSQRIKGHVYSPKNFGYKVCASKEKLEKGLSSLFLNQLGPQIKKNKISAYVFTQLSDVEQETNGLISYDREVIKADVDLMKRLNDSMELK